MTDALDRGSSLIPASLQDDPLKLLEIVAKGATAIDPLVGRFAQLCVDLARERRLEIEARLAARLQELSLLFAKLDELRASEVAERELQFRALSTLLDIAKSSRDVNLIAQAMQCFQDYVRSAPALTRDFSDALKGVNFSIDTVRDEPS